MKKTAILAGLLMAIQVSGLKAWDFFKSSSSQESSSSAAVSSSEGGTVTVGDKTYQVEPGQTIQVSGGGVNAQVNTVQESGKEPVTTVFVEESEPVALIDGKPAAPVAQATAQSEEEKEEENEEIEDDLDMDDAYEE